MDRLELQFRIDAISFNDCHGHHLRVEGRPAASGEEG
jgi:hypothetical protein